MKPDKIIILIGSIRVIVITQPSVKDFMGKMFEDFIRYARQDKYRLMCSIISHDKKQPSYEFEESSIGDRLIPKNTTID